MSLYAHPYGRGEGSDKLFYLAAISPQYLVLQAARRVQARNACCQPSLGAVEGLGRGVDVVGYGLWREQNDVGKNLKTAHCANALG